MTFTKYVFAKSTFFKILLLKWSLFFFKQCQWSKFTKEQDARTTVELWHGNETKVVLPQPDSETAGDRLLMKWGWPLVVLKVPVGKCWEISRVTDQTLLRRKALQPRLATPKLLNMGFQEALQCAQGRWRGKRFHALLLFVFKVK